MLSFVSVFLYLIRTLSGFFHIICSAILSTCRIVPYHNWKLFVILEIMMFYMRKIFLRYDYSICASILVFLQLLEMVQSFQVSSTALNVPVELLNHMLYWMNLHQMQYLLQILWQIVCSLLHCTWITWIINSFSGLTEYAVIWLSHLAVFFAKIGYQKYNALG